jgi:hypothetical protein
MSWPYLARRDHWSQFAVRLRDTGRYGVVQDVRCFAVSTMVLSWRRRRAARAWAKELGRRALIHWFPIAGY